MKSGDSERGCDMGRNFEELRARMTPESRARAQEEAAQMERAIRFRKRARRATMLGIILSTVALSMVAESGSFLGACGWVSSLILLITIWFREGFSDD